MSTPPSAGPAASATDTGWFTNTDPSLECTWQPVATVAEWEESGGMLPFRLNGRSWLLLAGDDGPNAVPDRCTHRLAKLSLGRLVDGTVECPYHGYRFAADGRCVEIPALGPDAPVPPKAHLDAAWGCEVHYGLVWVSPEEALTPIPAVPEIDDPDFDAVMLPTQVWSATAAQMADNFLDVGHFPFIHLGTIGNPDDRLVEAMHIERDGWTFTVDHTHLSNALDGGTTTAEAEGRDLHYIATAPHHVYLRIRYLTSGLVLSMTFFHQAVDESTTKVFGMYLRNDLRDGTVTIDETTAFQLAVGAEDKVFLETLEVKAVAVDPTYEVHTRADRNTLELRRMLRDLATAAAPDAPITLQPRPSGPRPLQETSA